jgi:hypothetical protein
LVENPFDVPFLFDWISRCLSDTEALAERLYDCFESAVIAADRKQARVIFRFVKGLLNKVPMLARMIERETADSFDLTNSITIEIQAASFRSTRGYTCLPPCVMKLHFGEVAK